MSTSETLIIRKPWLSFQTFRYSVVSLIFITSFFVKIEPSPSDLLGVLAVFLFAWNGLHISRYFAAPLLFLIIYIVAGIIGIATITAPGPNELNPFQYSIGIAYTALTGFFLACFLATDTHKRFYQIENSYIIGAVIGSILGFLLLLRIEPFISIFLAIPGISWADYYHRAVGGYKDPNVYSTWLVFPAIMMAHGLMLGRIRLNIISFLSFMAILGAIFFAYSRGAWTDLVGGLMLTIVLTVALSPTNHLRSRVTLYTVIGLAVVALSLVVLLSIPAISEAFLDRFTLLKDYDSGETGRFGNQLNSLPYLMTHPFGYGPYRYQEIFNVAPHNTFLNSFASGGWLGGYTYLLLFLTTCYMGFKAIFTPSPYQVLAIPIFSTYFIMTLQGLQIDNEHWRHLYWIMGMVWAVYAAMKEQGINGFSAAEIIQGWDMGTATATASDNDDDDEFE